MCLQIQCTNMSHRMSWWGFVANVGTTSNVAVEALRWPMYGTADVCGLQVSLSGSVGLSQDSHDIGVLPGWKGTVLPRRFIHVLHISSYQTQLLQLLLTFQPCRTVSVLLAVDVICCLVLCSTFCWHAPLAQLGMPEGSNMTAEQISHIELLIHTDFIRHFETTKSWLL